MIYFFWKLTYLISHANSVFSLPGLRKIRNFVTSKHLNCGRNCNFGDRVNIHHAHMSPDTKISISEGFRVGDDSYVDYTGGIVVGKNVTISEAVRIYTHEHPVDGVLDWRANPFRCSSLTLEDFSWIGSGSIVLERVNYIGKGAIVAAGSVVVEDVADYSIVAGNPAKVLRMRKLDSAID